MRIWLINELLIDQVNKKNSCILEYSLSFTDSFNVLFYQIF